MTATDRNFAEGVGACRDCLDGMPHEQNVACAPTELYMYAKEMRAQGYHQCPDGVWRKTPSNEFFDGLCNVCEHYQSEAADAS